MTGPVSALYFGNVVHKRVRHHAHKLKYRVFALLADVNELEAMGKRLRLFSYNGFNLFSFYDRDYGNGGNLRDYLRNIAIESGHGDTVCRFMILSYPRILGYAFNPLTTYYGLDSKGQVRLLIYEVNNTFGGRHSYVIPAEPGSNGLVTQSCEKQLYVSPFNSENGTYAFHVTPPEESLTLGITLRDEAGPILLAHFKGQRYELRDSMLLRALAKTGWMSIKIITAIHYEALKLWIKGMRLMPRPTHKPASITYVD